MAYFNSNLLLFSNIRSSNNLEELIKAKKRVNNNGNQESIHCDLYKGAEDVF